MMFGLLAGWEWCDVALIRRRDKGKIDRRESLSGVPILNSNVSIEQKANGVPALRARITRGTSFLERLRPTVNNRSYELDEFGAFVVRQMDNQKTVLEIINAFEKAFGMSRREAELGVVAFLKMLMKRNLVSVVIKQPGDLHLAAS